MVHKDIREFRGHSANIFHALFDSTNRHILSCSNDHTIKYYDVEGPSRPLVTMDNHSGAVYKVSFCPSNDNLYLSASEDRTVSTLSFLFYPILCSI